MSHYFDTGMCVRQPSWHQLENLLDEYPDNWDDARKAAGLDWDPIAEPLFARMLDDGEQLAGIQAILENTPADERAAALMQMFSDSVREVEGFQRIRRSDEFGTTLGTTTTSYEPITHGDYGDILKAVLDQENVKYETAGSVQRGRQTWALAMLDEPVQLKGKGRGARKDPSLTLPYMALTARHDGDGSARLQPTSVRIVCANTFSWAETEADAHGAVFSFRHTKNWKEHIEDAKQAVAGTRQVFADYQAWAGEMLTIKIDAAQQEAFIVEFVPAPIGEIKSKVVQGNIDKARQQIRDILAGPTIEGIQGTGFALVQAAGEYEDWYRASRSSERRFRRQLLKTDRVKTQAVAIVKNLAGVS